MLRWLISLFFLTSLPSQATWSLTPTLPVGPALALTAGAYSVAEQRLIVFGGFNAYWAAVNSTWSFDNVAWTQLSGSMPPARFGHAMAYDWARGRVVLFGGTATVFGTPVFADTWEYAGGSWVQVVPVNSPLGRSDHAMSYDIIAGRTILFGGRAPIGGPLVPLSDTWAWDGVSWTQIQTPGPSARWNHAMSYDLVRQKTVLFGGNNIPVNTLVQLDDTWEFDGQTWNFAANGGIPGRGGHAMAYDLVRTITVLHGGGVNSDETWEWDGIQWTNTVVGAHIRTEHVLAYDVSIQRIVQIGGSNPITHQAQNEVWTYGVPTIGSYVSQGAGCPGSAGQSQLVAPVGSIPMIGQTSTLSVNPSYWPCFFVFGWSDLFDGPATLPLGLASYGMPGCSLLVSRDYTSSAPPVFGTVSIQVYIPYVPTLPGTVFFIQAFPIDLSPNFNGLAATNSLRATVGRL